MNNVCELRVTDKETNNNQKGKAKNHMRRNKSKSSSTIKVKMMSCQRKRNFPLDIEGEKPIMSDSAIKVEHFPLYDPFPLVLVQLC